MPRDGIPPGRRDSFACRAGLRFYRLYLPPGAARPRGLIVLLHGCGARADSFAAATGLLPPAAREGLIVLAPEQSRRRNFLGCWNWFRPEHRARDRGEAAILAEMAASVARTHGVPPRRVFLAGHSAGAAMALALADAYPDRFAAVFAHSGVDPGGVRDGEAARARMRGLDLPTAPRRSGPGVPALIYQGDADPVVHPANARAIARARGRRARVVVIEGGGHAWDAGASRAAMRFFRARGSRFGRLGLWLAARFAGAGGAAGAGAAMTAWQAGRAEL